MEPSVMKQQISHPTTLTPDDLVGVIEATGYSANPRAIVQRVTS